MVQLIPLPPIISCFSKIQNGLPFWRRLTQVILEKRPLKVCMYVCVTCILLSPACVTGIGRKVAVVNLDPANDSLPYACSVDISELIMLSEAMDLLHLGPNGGLIYCMEYLERNIDWLQQKLLSPDLKDHYLLFDCPGQVELYTHNNCIRRVFSLLTRDGYRLAAVHLADAHYCTEPSKFISVLLTSLTAMLQVIACFYVLVVQFLFTVCQMLHPDVQ